MTGKAYRDSRHRYWYQCDGPGCDKLYSWHAEEDRPDVYFFENGETDLDLDFCTKECSRKYATQQREKMEQVTT